MTKKVVSSVPIHKKKLTKRDSNKKRVLLKLRKVLDFLKSDTYMFAPLISSQASDHGFSCTTTTSNGTEAYEPFKEKNEELFGKVKNYMKSDCYMYNPLVVHQPWLHSSIPVVNPPTDTVRKEDSVKNVAEETRDHLGQKIKSISIADQLVDGHPYARTTVIKHTLLQQETVKHVIKQNCLSSSVRGDVKMENKGGKGAKLRGSITRTTKRKGLLGANARKLV